MTSHFGREVSALVSFAVLNSLVLLFPTTEAADRHTHVILKRAVINFGRGNSQGTSNGPLLLPQSWETNNNLLQQQSSSSSSSSENGRLNDVGSNNVIYDPSTGYANNPSGGSNQSPHFSQSLYNFQVTQCGLNSYVGQVFATNTNGDSIQYTLTNNNNGNFAIDRTGQITVASNALSSNPVSFQTLQVQASDSRGSLETATVYLTLQCNGGNVSPGNRPVYDPSTGYANNPAGSANRLIYFGQSFYSFPLTSCVANAYVGSVNAISVGGGQPQYTLQQTQNDYTSSAFAIDAYGGQITLVSPSSLSQTGTTTTLYVQATDSQSGSTAQTTVSVYANCNSNGGNSVTYDPSTSTYYKNPTLTYYYPSYATYDSTGYSGYNGYNGNNVVYDYSTGYPNYGNGGGSGVVYDTATSYYNYPSASNYGNRQPTFPQSYYTFYDTSCSPNGFIGNVNAQDPDNDPIQYSIVYNSGAGGTGYYNGAYKIDSSTGYITRSLGSTSTGYNGGASTFQVLANDRRGRSATATVSIQSQCLGGIGSGNGYSSFGFG